MTATGENYYYKVLMVTSCGDLLSEEQPVTLPPVGALTKAIQYNGKATTIYFQPGDSLSTCANTGADRTLKVGTAPGAVYRSLIEFDLSSIPVDTEIIDARVSLKQQGAQTAVPIDVHTLARGWQEGTGTFDPARCTRDGATWSEASGGVTWQAQGGDFSPDPWAGVAREAADTSPWDDYDVTELAAEWRSYGMANFGILLKAADETFGTGRTTTYASDDAQGGSRPVLAVTYLTTTPDSDQDLKTTVIGEAPPAGSDVDIWNAPGNSEVPPGVQGLPDTVPIQAAPDAARRTQSTNDAPGSTYSEPIRITPDQTGRGVEFQNDDGKFTIYFKCLTSTTTPQTTVGPGYIARFVDNHFRPVPQGQQPPAPRYDPVLMVQGNQPNGNHFGFAGGIGLFGLHFLRGPRGGSDAETMARVIEGQRCANPVASDRNKRGGVDASAIKILNCSDPLTARPQDCKYWTGVTGTNTAVGVVDMDVWFREGRTNDSGAGPSGKDLFLVKYRWRIYREIVKGWISVTTYANAEGPSAVPFVKEPKLLAGTFHPPGDPARYAAGGFPSISYWGRNPAKSFVFRSQRSGLFGDSKVIVHNDHIGAQYRTRARWDYNTTRTGKPGVCGWPNLAERACLSVSMAAYSGADIDNGLYGKNAVPGKYWQSGFGGLGFDSWAKISQYRAAADDQDHPNAQSNPDPSRREPAWGCGGTSVQAPATPGYASVRHWEEAGLKETVDVPNQISSKFTWYSNTSPFVHGATMFHGWTGGRGFHDCEPLYREFGGNGETYGAFVTISLNGGFAKVWRK